MDKRFAIFDMDGTLVDSMVYWKYLASEFLESKGVSEVSASVLERIKPMTMTESAALFIEAYGLPGTAESVAAEMNAMMDEHYRRDIPLKPGVAAYLEVLRQKGVSMCVASATAEDLMKACLTRLGVAHYFPPCFPVKRWAPVRIDRMYIGKLQNAWAHNRRRSLFMKMPCTQCKQPRMQAIMWLACTMTVLLRTGRP